MHIDKKIISLRKHLAGLGKVAIAYSGGVDSTFLLKVCLDVLGKENVLACICESELMSEKKYNAAIETARELGVEPVQIVIDILSDKDFIANPANKCYICKNYIYGEICKQAKAKGFDNVLCGTNKDDLSDYRPGNIAADEFNIQAPLAEVGLVKAEIRKLSKNLGLATADVPSSPCLASRIPYFESISRDKLKQIGEAEDFLRSIGFTILRVRHHGDIARIELEAGDIEKACEEKMRAKILDKFKIIGFKYVTIDMQGFRMGSLNEGIV